jgi:hypothetical protein
MEVAKDPEKDFLSEIFDVAAGNVQLREDAADVLIVAADQIFERFGPAGAVRVDQAQVTGGPQLLLGVDLLSRLAGGRHRNPFTGVVFP